MWLTIWVSGIAILSFGSNNISVSECLEMRSIMTEEIHANVYERGNGTSYVIGPDGTEYAWNDWYLTCEQEQIDIGTMR